MTAGQRLRDEIALFDNSVENWAKSSGNLVTSGLGGMGGFLVLAGFAGVLAVAIWNPLSMTMIGLIPGAFAVCGTSLMATGSGTKRTRSGRDLWSRVGGFRRMLATPSSKERFDFSGREELYTAYIPWAVALDCAKEWAAKYRTEMGTEPPVPHYFAGALRRVHPGGVRRLDDQRLRRHRRLRHLVVQRDAVLVVLRWWRRRVLRRRRRRRWRRRFVVTVVTIASQKQ